MLKQNYCIGNSLKCNNSRRGQFVDAALGCLDAEPAQEARHGRPVVS